MLFDKPRKRPRAPIKTHHDFEGVSFLTAREARIRADQKLREYILSSICTDVLNTLDNGSHSCTITFESVSDHFLPAMRDVAFQLRGISGYTLDWEVRGNSVVVFVDF